MVYENNDGQLVGLLSLVPITNFFFLFSFLVFCLVGNFRGIGNILVIQRDVLGTLVRALANEPPDGDKDSQTAGHQTGVVHRGSIDGQIVGEAEDDDEGKNINAGQRVDNVSNLVVHEEVSRSERGAASHDVGEDGHEVGQRRQLDEAANEGAKGSDRTKVDAGQDGDEHTASQGGVERVVESAVDAAEPLGERSGTVTGEGPQGPTSSDIAARCSDQGWNKGNDQEAQSTAAGAGRLVVDLSQGEFEGGVSDSIEVLNRVENGDHVKDASDKTDAHLGKHGLGDVAARLGDLLGQVGRAVRGTDTVSTVEHTHDKDEALLRVTSRVLPVLPNILVGHVSSTVDMRHHSADNDGDEDTRQDEEHANVTNEGQPAVHEQHDRAANPSADDETEENVPGLGNEVRVHQRIHRHGLLGHDQTHRGST